MFTESTLNEINRAIPLGDFLKKSKGGLYCCPWCNSGHGKKGTGAVSVDDKKEHLGYCHSCETGFNLVQLVEKVEGLDFVDAVNLIAERSGTRLEYDGTDDFSPPEGWNAWKHRNQTDEDEDDDDDDDPLVLDMDDDDDPRDLEDKDEGSILPHLSRPVKHATTDLYRDDIKKWHDDAAQTDYFHRRGFTDSTIAAFMLGWDAAKKMIVVPYPYTKSGYWVKRNLEPDKDNRQIRKPPTDDAGPEPLFCGPLLYEKDPCFIVEGQLDAISIMQAGGHAVALGNKGKNRLIEQVEKKAPAAPLILCLDDDPPGRKAQAELADALDDLAIPYTIARFDRDKYPEDLKDPDPNDYLRADSFAFKKDIERNIFRTADPSELANDPTGIDRFLKEIYSERFKAVPTGISEIDDILEGGLMPQTLVMLGAEPGAGKTSMLAMIFEAMAASGNSSLFFNLEMSREQLLARSISRRILVNSNGTHKLTGLDILRGFNHTEPTKKLVNEAAREYRNEVGDRLQYNPGKCGTDLDAILSFATKRADQALEDGKPAPNLAIDYLQLLTSSKREDPVEIIKRAVAGLKEYAVKYSAIVFCVIAQSRRANENATPTMTAGRDTSAIEYSADLLLQLIREDPEDDPDKVTLYVNKSRFTQITREGEGYTFHFHGGQAYFTAWEKAEKGDVFHHPRV